MNWQIVIGCLFVISSFCNITKDFSAFLFALVIGFVFVFFGIRRKKATASSFTRTLTEETFYASGVYYYEDTIQKLSCANPEWKLSKTDIISSEKCGKKIFRYNYINKPVKLIPEPENIHDKNAVSIHIAGELVGYISKDDNLHVLDILKNHDVKHISGFIGGGEYKIVSEDGETAKFEIDHSVNVRIRYV